LGTWEKGIFKTRFKAQKKLGSLGGATCKTLIPDFGHPSEKKNMEEFGSHFTKSE